jgi:hypothetical protein
LAGWQVSYPSHLRQVRLTICLPQAFYPRHPPTYPWGMAMQLTVKSDLPRLAAWTAQLSKNMRIKVADSMTAGARAAERAIKAQAPTKINNPTRWTMNSVFVKPARSNNLEVGVGFKDYAVKGTPAAKYLQPIATGTQRTQKGSERLLERSGLIRRGQFIVPTGVYPLKLNSFGNLPASVYVQVLSRLKALGEQGYTANVANTARSQSKRASRDYFVGRPGGAKGHIYARVGRKPKGNPGGMGRPMTVGLPRGFHTVVSVTSKKPSYSLRFDTRKVLESTFESVYRSTLASLLAA